MEQMLAPFVGNPLPACLRNGTGMALVINLMEVPRRTWMVRRRNRHPRTPGFRLVEPTARREGRPYYSRSLRSVQSRTASGICDKRVPSFVVAVSYS